MCHDYYTTDDQVAAGRGPRGPAPRPGGPARLLLQVLPQGLHPAPAVRPAGPEDLLQDRLPRPHPAAARLRRAARGTRPGRRPALLHPLLRRQAAPKKGEFVLLLFQATARAREGGLIGAKPEAALDATGLESRHTSQYFFKRAGRKHSARLWTKLTVVCHTGSHLFTAATVSTAPSNDSPQLRPAMQQASLAVTWDRVLADAAFDSEDNHRLCREGLGVRSTVIPLNRRNRGRKWPKTRYRRQMKKRFFKRVYGQRWQAESAFSRHKRLLGSALRARSDAARERECYLRVLTHDVMILADTG